MSFAPGLFYVYFIGVSSDGYTHNSRTHLVAFVSRSAADNYWRAIQLSAHSTRSTFRRYSPQLIMAPLPNVPEGWKCIIQTLTDNYNLSKVLIAPPDSRPDNINGQSFYIRSVTYPDSFWTYNELGAGHSTIGSRQKYTIKRVSPLNYEPRTDEDVLIGEDYVNIFLFDTNMVMKWYESGNKEVELRRESWSGDTTFSPETEKEIFKFSFFTDGRPSDSERYWKHCDSWEFVI